MSAESSVGVKTELGDMCGEGAVDKIGEERLTCGIKGPSDASLLLEETCESVVSFAGNEASSKTTCLDR